MASRITKPWATGPIPRSRGLVWPVNAKPHCAQGNSGHGGHRGMARATLGMQPAERISARNLAAGDQNCPSLKGLERLGLLKASTCIQVLTVCILAAGPLKPIHPLCEALPM